MSLLVLGVLAWQEGGESVAALLIAGAACSIALVLWLRRRKREGKATLFDPNLFDSPLGRFADQATAHQHPADDDGLHQEADTPRKQRAPEA